jgi:thioredoxin 1
MRRRFVTIGFGLLVSILLQLASSDAAGPKIDLNALAAKKIPVLLEFGRGWCIPCKYMKPILNDMAKAFKGSAIVTTVDMDANRNLVRAFRIRMMPTQVFLSPDGKEFFRHEGTLEREQIVQIFAKMGVRPGSAPRASGSKSAKPVLPPLPLPGSGQ